MAFINQDLPFLSNLESLVTIIALVLGGIWTWKAFFRERSSFPRVTLKHQILDHYLTDDKTFLHVSVVIENTGHILIPLESLQTRVQLVRPLWGRSAERISEGKPIPEENEVEVQWPTLEEKEKKWSKHEAEIEPGERDQCCFDFILDAEVRTVIVYSYLANTRKSGKGLGWGLTSPYNLTSGEERRNTHEESQT